jgi:two-component system chemotaxis sensor kinase CheA
MSLDLAQFHQVFIDESFEGLDAMEAALLALDLAQVDAELINTIFRAAHSIKGGSATFGFNVIADFTHVLETLLDQARSGTRPISADDVNLLLQSVDCMRELLTQLQRGVNQETPTSESLKTQFYAVLANTHLPHESSSQKSTEPQAKPAVKTWSIRFIPGRDILKSGNDPVRIFAALEDLSSLQIRLLEPELPAFAEMEPESLYLAWELTLETEAAESAIREVFEWVIDECELTLSDVTPVPCNVIELPKQTETKTASNENSSIRVGIDKIDSLVNMVGELVIIQSMLGEIGSDFTLAKLPKLIEGLAQLEQNTRELQESVMRIRMLPLSFSFSRFPRMVRDLAQQLHKKIHFETHGEQTELDKTVMEKIGDPLVHLVRNAVDHGIETPALRLAAGKPETGHLLLNAYHQGGNVIIEISDDGAGLDREKILRKAQQKGLLSNVDVSLLSDEQVYDLIFQPGFSTAEAVSEVSGRGVGMDVVKRNIQALKGSVEILSRKGEGSTIRIRLPLTLAIMDGQLVRVGEQIYIFPLIAIVESMRCRPENLSHIGANRRIFQLRDEYVPVLELSDLLHIPSQREAAAQPLMVVVESDNGKVGIVVDELLAQQQVVIKSLEQNYRRVEGISGATILGDGTVALIVDIPGIIALASTDHTIAAANQQAAQRKRAQS